MISFDIVSLIPGKKKYTGSGWVTFNAPCCQYRGHQPDKKGRGGIKSEPGIQGYHCFNCDFKCKFQVGKALSRSCRQLLLWLGMDEDDIARWNLESLKHKDLLEIIAARRHRIKAKFVETSLPGNAELLNETLPEHQRFVEYIKTRGFKPGDYPFMVSPSAKGREKNRVIIPYTYENKIVGHISRFIDDHDPKYIKEQPPGYLFGYDLQQPDWNVCIVVEGVFDALSIDGCALTSDTISDDQADILLSLNRKIIVVPDFDKTGLDICSRALDLGFHVSIPNWEDGIKDVNDAVRRYGKLPTLLSILQHATTSKIKLKFAKKRYDSE